MAFKTKPIGGKRPGAGRKSNAAKLLEAGFTCAAFGPEVQAKTWKSMLASADENIVLKAAIYLTDRLYGRPLQQTELSGPNGGPIPVSLEIDL